MANFINQSPTAGIQNGFNQPSNMIYPNTNPVVQFPYNNLITNSPYENYMGKPVQQQQNFLNQNQFLRCRPVTSKEQAMASQIDLDGSLWIFTDINNEKIYTKKINNDGTAAFNTYVLSKEVEQPPVSDYYVTREEFNRVINMLINNKENNATQQPNEQKSIDF